MKKVYITGISGTGKTTIAKELNKNGVTAYDLDEVPNLARWVNRATDKPVDYEAELTRSFIDAHKWVCNIKLLKQLISQDDVVVLLGNADNLDEVIPLFDKTILLYCSPETFLKRIAERVGNDFGKEKSAQQYLLDTYKQFENKLIDMGAVPVYVEDTLEAVLKRVILEIK